MSKAFIVAVLDASESMGKGYTCNKELKLSVALTFLRNHVTNMVVNAKTSEFGMG